MLNKKSILLITLFALHSFAKLPVCADVLGDPASPLLLKEWIKGGPADLASGEGKKTIVIEFWKTTCPHCTQSVLRLADIQDRYGKEKLIVLGISDEEPEEVKKYLEENKEINYDIAIDDDEKTKHAYMEAYGVDGVPHAFVVDKNGHVAWEGHPLHGLEDAVAEIVAGKYDLEAARKASMAKRLLLPYLYLVIETDEYDIAREIGDKILVYANNDSKLLDRMARRIVSDERIKKPDIELAAKAIKRAYEITSGTSGEVLETYAVLLARVGRKKEAEAFLEEAKRLKTKENEQSQQPGELDKNGND